jgi:8-oxo-dGTP pyrophosphatase MutT (NUDIX family)
LSDPCKNNNLTIDLLLHHIIFVRSNMEITENNSSSFCKNLGLALQGTLPGVPSQLKMASGLRLDDMKKEFDLTRAEKSAVLIFFYPCHGSVCFPLILRPEYDGIHASQISFPGGRMEQYDSSLVQTALREANEELNIKSDEIQLLGKLTDIYIPPSNYLVTPVVGYSSSVPDFVVDPNEVEKIITADVNLLFDDTLIKEKIIIAGKMSIRAPYFEIQGQTVWGATAMILSELKDILISLESL